MSARTNCERHKHTILISLRITRATECQHVRRQLANTRDSVTSDQPQGKCQARTNCECTNPHTHQLKQPGRECQHYSLRRHNHETQSALMIHAHARNVTHVHPAMHNTRDAVSLRSALARKCQALTSSLHNHTRLSHPQINPAREMSSTYASGNCTTHDTHQPRSTSRTIGQARTTFASAHTQYSVQPQSTGKGNVKTYVLRTKHTRRGQPQFNLAREMSSTYNCEAQTPRFSSSSDQHGHGKCPAVLAYVCTTQRIRVSL